MKGIDGMKETFKYGAFSLPFVNYLLCEGDIPRDCKEILGVLKLAWKGSFKKAIQKIDKAVKSCRSEAAKYLLLANKLSFLKSTGKPDIQLYMKLKKSLPKMSRSIRDTVLVTLISFEASGAETLRKVRVWKNKYRKSTLSFLYLSLARREAAAEKLAEAVHGYIQAYRLAREIPHPTALISSLNDLAWDIKERHPKIAYDISRKAVFWLGYYREVPGNLFAALDTLFVIEKSVEPVKLWHTARIITSFSPPGKYASLLEEAKRLVPDFTRSSYPNSSQLRRYIKKAMQSGKTISLKGVSDILKGKTKTIRADTIRKMLAYFGAKTPFPVYNEWVKMEVETSFKEAVKRIKEMATLERKRRFLSTYMAQTRRRKLYISRKDKLEKAFKLLGNIEEFEEFMGKRYETMGFVIEMVKAHPYIEGRKEAVKKALSRMGKRKLERFARKYIQMKEKDQKLFDRFLRNYGRYDGIKFGMRFKRPEVVREFARRYSLKIQPSFGAFWNEEDGRVRRKLERILRHMVGD